MNMNYLISPVPSTLATRDNMTDFKNYYSEYRICELIWTIVPPILLVLGTVGNCLTIVVCIKTKMRTKTIAVYLSTLAVSDIVALNAGLLTEWLRIVFNSEIDRYGSVGCKIHSWLLFTSVQLSAWIIVAITVERVLCVWLPFRARMVESTAFAKVVVITLCVFLLLLNTHAVYGLTINSENTSLYPLCAAVNTQYLHFFETVWPYIDSILYCFIPCVFILSGNSLIIVRLKRKRSIEITSGQRRHYNSVREPRTQSLLPIVFTLNTVFLLTTSPISVFQLVFNFTHIPRDGLHLVKNAQLFLGWTILLMLMFSNHAINCLLYCLSGTKFRQELLSLFCKKA